MGRCAGDGFDLAPVLVLMSPPRNCGGGAGEVADDTDDESYDLVEGFGERGYGLLCDDAAAIFNMDDDASADHELLPVFGRAKDGTSSPVGAILGSCLSRNIQKALVVRSSVLVWCLCRCLSVSCCVLYLSLCLWVGALALALALALIVRASSGRLQLSNDDNGRRATGDAQVNSKSSANSRRENGRQVRPGSLLLRPPLLLSPYGSLNPGRGLGPSGAVQSWRV